MTLQPRYSDFVLNLFDDDFNKLVEFVKDIEIDDDVYSNIDSKFKQALKREDSMLPVSLNKKQQQSIVKIANKNLAVVQDKIVSKHQVNISFEMVLTCGPELTPTRYKIQVAKYILAIVIYLYCYLVVASNKEDVDKDLILFYFKFRFLFDTFWVPFLLSKSEVETSTFLKSTFDVVENLRQRKFFKKLDARVEECKVKFNKYEYEKRFEPYYNKLCQVFASFKSKSSFDYNAVSVLKVLAKQKSNTKKVEQAQKSDLPKNNLARAVKMFKAEFPDPNRFNRVFDIANSLAESKVSSCLDKLDFCSLPYKVARAFYLWDPNNTTIVNRFDLFLKQVEEQSSLSQIDMMSLIKQNSSQQDEYFDEDSMLSF